MTDLPYKIVRSFSAGVFAGHIESRNLALALALSLALALAMALAMDMDYG
jgi:hypothetical protein